jgi:hypothetical protein
MSRISRVVLLCTLLSVALTASPSLAQSGSPEGPTSAQCSFVFPARFAPGFTLASRPGTGTSDGQTGSISCHGQFDGHTVTGPGSFGFQESYIANCLVDQGSGTYFATVPTDAGSIHLEGPYTYTRLGLTFSVEATRPGERFDGSGIVVPTKGDCLLNPITDTTVYMTGSFADAPKTPSTSVTRCDLDAVIVQLNCRTHS